MPQTPLTQVAVPPPVGQGVHELPQLRGLVSDTHSPEQLWKPVLQTMKQLVPLQAGVPFGAVGQGEQEVPHVSGLVFETHWPEQSWVPGPQVRPQ
jgi:hypothetical protein